MDERKKSADEYLFEITSFLISSAKRCLGPEYMYGAGRLVQTMNLLSHLPEYIPGLNGNSLLTKASTFLETDQHWWHTEKLSKFINEMSEALLEEMKKKLSGKSNGS